MYGALRPRAIAVEVFVNESRLGPGRKCQVYFDARVLSIDVLIEVGFDDSVVVDAESFADCILRNFEPAIDVSS